MATPAKVEVREERMDLVSCMVVRGEYDTDRGVCRYKVKINGNGEEEYLNKENKKG